MSNARHSAFSALVALRASLKKQKPPEKKIDANPEAENQPEASESELWQKVARNIAPLVDDHVFPSAAPPLPYPRQRERDETLVLAESLCASDDMPLESDDGDFYLARGVSRKTLAELRRGRWVVQAELDLHGMTREDAHFALNHFLDSCLTHGIRCFRLVHGKGLSSPGKRPVLRPLVRQWLACDKNLLAFCEAKERDGGSGALLVLLRSIYSAANAAQIKRS